MRIVSHKKLKEFYETKGYEDSRVALERWYNIAENFAEILMPEFLIEDIHSVGSIGQVS